MERDRPTIVCTGGAVGALARDQLPSDAFVIAADSGIEVATALGLRVDLAVGDFDSVDPAALTGVLASGAEAERHPAEKDATDLELALAAAVRRGARKVTVVGGAGGRLDHLLANALLLCSPSLADLEIELLPGGARLVAVHEHVTLTGEPGELVSLLPIGGTARGVRTEGLRYPLAGEDLEPGTTRGVSNVLVERSATVTLEAGTLLAVFPGERAPEPTKE